MVQSINANSNALAALANLNATDSNLIGAQASGRSAASSAQSSLSAWSVVQDQTGGAGGLDTVKTSLDRASSISDVASAAGQSISDLLTQIKATVASGTDASLTETLRATLNASYTSLLSQISGVIDSASFDGANLLNGSLSGNVSFLASGDSGSALTLSVQDMTLGGSIITLKSNSTIGTATAATKALSQVDQSLSNVSDALAEITSQANEISVHNTFVGALSEVLQTSAGGSTATAGAAEASTAEESAKLQALQLRQQLSTQSLSIANQGPQVILSLFR